MVERILSCALFVALLFLVPTVNAQERDSLTLDFHTDISSGLGYKPGRFGVETTLQKMITTRHGFSLSSYADRARKNPGNGFSIGGRGVFRYYAKGFFIGGGFIAARQHTDFYNKLSLSPLIEVGRIERHFVVRGSVRPVELSSPNKGFALGINVDYYRPTRRRVGLHLAFGESVSHFRCNQTANGLLDSCTGAQLRLGVGVYIKRGKVE